MEYITHNRGIEPEAVDHQGANGGIRAADNQGSRLESEAMDGVYTSIVLGWEYVS